VTSFRDAEGSSEPGLMRTLHTVIDTAMTAGTSTNHQFSKARFSIRIGANVHPIVHCSRFKLKRAMITMVFKHLSPLRVAYSASYFDTVRSDALARHQSWSQAITVMSSHNLIHGSLPSERFQSRGITSFESRLVVLILFRWCQPKHKSL
jgi:hypothetical protein